MPDRYIYRMEDVTSAQDTPHFVARNHLEQTQLRRMIPSGVQNLCEFGCGYGRILVSLQDWPGGAYGVEREPGLVAMAKTVIYPSLIRQVESLAQTGIIPVDLVYTFTVLQHLHESELIPVITEIKRCALKYVILVEQTDLADVNQFPEDFSKHICQGRSIDQYKELMKPFKFQVAVVREKERGSPDRESHLMIFMK